MKVVLGSRLTLPALAAATSLVALAAPAHAQSVCTAVGTTFSCTDGGVTGTLDATATVLATPQGLEITDATDVLNATATGTINTTAVQPGLIAVAPAGISFGGDLSINATGTGPGAILLAPSGATNATLGSITTAGDFGLLGIGGTGAAITTGSILSAGVNAANIGVPGNLEVPALTVGAGAAVIANAGDASLLTNGSITVSGAADPLVGAIVSAPAGAASAAVTDNVTVTSTSGGAAFGVVALGSTGASVSVGGLTSITGIGGTALAAVTDTGTASVTCGNVSTTGDNNTGVFAYGDAVQIACGTINTGTGANTVGLEAAGLTSVTGTIGDVTTSGAGSIGVLINDPATLATPGSVTFTTGRLVSGGAGLLSRTVDGNQVLTVAGAQTVDTAIDAEATGTGNVTVTTTAPVVSTAGLGIRAVATSGAVTVNAGAVNGATGGILATNTGAGAVTVNATGGQITSAGGDAIFLETPGTATVNVASGANVQALGANDAIDIRGGTANNVVVNGTVGVAPGGTGYSIAATGGPAAITIGSTGNLGGPLLLTGGADVLTNGGGLFLQGGSDFGAGADTLNNNWYVALAPGASVAGLETFNNNAAGTVELTGPGTVTLTGTTFNNAGQLLATHGASALTVGAFNNTGLINLVDGAANDTLTINAPYNGAGAARLAVDVNQALTAADRLVVNGAITGSTVVDVNLVGPDALYNPTGVAVVTGAGPVPAGAFTLAPADAQIGFLNYGLRPVGNDVVLASTLDPSFTDLAMVGSMGRDLWYQSFDAYNDAIRGRHAGSFTSGHPIGIWGQLYESKDRYGDFDRTVQVNNTQITYSDRLRTHRRGGQAGIEYRGPGFVIGATGGYEWARSEEQPATARIKAEGYNYGAYALFGMESGLYGGLLVKRDEYHVNFANDARMVSFRNKAHSTGVDGEVGFKTPNTGAIGFDLNAGLSWVKTDIDPWNQYGLTFDWQGNKSLRGRIGARVLFPQLMGAYLGAKVFHEFKDDGYLHVAGVTSTVADVDMARRGTWVRLEGGLDGSGTSGVLLGLWGDVGDTTSFGGRVGFRF